MNDLLASAESWLQRQRELHLSRPVVYRRGDACVELFATKGRTGYERSDASGVIVSATATDWLVPAGRLVLDGEYAIPRTGDRVVDASADRTAVYVVVSLGPSGAYERTGPEGATLRIHTKLLTEDRS